MRSIGLITQVGNAPSKLTVKRPFIGSSQFDFPAKAIWKFKAPHKVCFLVWAATRGKIPVEDMLKRRNFNLARRH